MACMQKLIKVVLTVAFAVVTGLGVTACGVKDSSVNDLKSPCAANEWGKNSVGVDPCVKRQPILNGMFVDLG
ncbi:exported hypothetical protein [Alphaproteobacteria bacterium]